MFALYYRLDDEDLFFNRTELVIAHHIDRLNSNLALVIPGKSFFRMGVAIRSCLSGQEIKHVEPLVRSLNTSWDFSGLFSAFFGPVENTETDTAISLYNRMELARRHLFENLLPTMFNSAQIGVLRRDAHANPDLAQQLTGDATLAFVRTMTPVELVETMNGQSDALTWIWFQYLTTFSRTIYNKFKLDPPSTTPPRWRNLMITVPPWVTPGSSEDDRKRFSAAVTSHRETASFAKGCYRQVLPVYHQLTYQNAPVIAWEETYKGFQDGVRREDAGSPKSDATHVIVLLHGLGASGVEMEILHNFVMAANISACLFIPRCLEGKTDLSIETQADLVAKEILLFIDRCGEVSCLSFMAHSLGSLVVRCLIDAELLGGDWNQRLHTFLSLGSPHLGIHYGNGSVMSAAMWLWKRFWVSGSVSFAQMMMTDARNPCDTLLFRLAHTESMGLAHFKHLIFVGSDQDKYAPIETSLLLSLGMYLSHLPKCIPLPFYSITHAPSCR